MLVAPDKICVMEYNNRYLACDAVVLPVSDTSKHRLLYAKYLSKNYLPYYFDNTPIPGFYLKKIYYGSSTYRWAIADPRGLCIPISDTNMLDIMLTSTVSNGFIHDTCLWVNDIGGNRSSLLSTASPKYSEILENSNDFKNKVKKKSVKIGDIVKMENGLEGKYLGKHDLFCGLHMNKARTELTAKVISDKDVIEVAPKRFFYTSNVGILSVREKSSENISKESGAEYITNSLLDKNSILTPTSRLLNNMHCNSDYNIAKLVGARLPSGVGIELDEMVLSDLHLHVNKYVYLDDSYLVVVEEANGNKYVATMISASDAYKKDFSNVRYLRRKIIKIDSNKMHVGEMVDSASSNLRGLDQYSKYYKIVKVVGDKRYT